MGNYANIRSLVATVAIAATLALVSGLSLTASPGAWAADVLVVVAVDTAGAPISGLELTACAYTCESAVSDANGEVRFSSAPQNDSSVNVTGGGVTTEYLDTSASVSFAGSAAQYPDLAFPGKLRMVFTRADWADINVTLVTSSGTPIVGESVRISSSGAAIIPDASTNDSGVAAFRLSPHAVGVDASDTYTVTAGGPPSSSWNAASVDLGTLSSQDRTPTLSPLSYSVSGTFTFHGSTDETKNRRMSVTWSTGSSSKCVDFVTDSFGEYSVQGIGNRYLNFNTASCNGQSAPNFDWPSGFSFVESNGATQSFDCALTRTGVEVTVLSGGQPAAHVTVGLAPSDDPSSVWYSTTNSEGKALILASPGTYFTTHRDEEWSPDHGKYEAVTNGESVTIDEVDSVVSDSLTVVRQASYPATPVSVSGRVVTGLEATPVVGATVSASSNFGTYPNQMSIYFSTVTDENGYYLLSEFPYGRVGISVQANGYRDSGSRQVMASQNQGNSYVQDFNLRPLPAGNLTVSGTLEDEDGHAVPSREISLYSMTGGGTPVVVSTDENGSWSFNNLFAGSYYLNVDTWSDELYQQAGWSSSYVNLAGDISDRRIVLKKRLTGTAHISGHVGEYVDSAGPGSATPLAGKNVSIYPRGGGNGFNTVTDANGDWVISGLPDGVEYFVNVQYEYQKYESQWMVTPIAAHENGGNPYIVLLKKVSAGTGSLAGRVKDAANYTNVSGISVSLFRSRGGMESRATTTNLDGEYSFGNLPQGEYGLTFDDGFSHYRTAFMSAEIDGSPNRINALLAPLIDYPGTITGQVFDERGVPLAGAYVSVWDPQHTDNGDAVGTDGSGNFRLKNVPVGVPVNLKVSPSWELSYELADDFETLVIDPNSPAVTRSIALKPAAVISGRVEGIPSTGNVPGVNVELIDKATLITVGAGYVNSQTGAYAIAAVHAGSYFLRFTQRPTLNRYTGRSGDSGGYPGEVVSLKPVYWTGTEFGTTDISAAMTISVGEGDRISNKSVTMSPGSKIVGAVYIDTPDGLTKITGTRWVNVTVFEKQANGSWMSVGYPDAASSYTNSRLTSFGLGEGRYKLKFEDMRRGNNSLATIYNGGASSMTEAPEIVIGNEQTITLDTTMRSAPPEKSAEAFELDTLATDVLSDTSEAIETVGSIEAGTEEQIFVGVEFAGEFVAAFANSTPRLLGDWTQVDSKGYITVSIPADLSGSHRIAVEDANENVVGWTSVDISGSGSSSTQIRTKSNTVATTPTALPTRRSTPKPNPITSSSPNADQSLDPQNAASVAWAWLLGLGLIAAAGVIVTLRIRKRRS